MPAKYSHVKKRPTGAQKRLANANGNATVPKDQKTPNIHADRSITKALSAVTQLERDDHVDSGRALAGPVADDHGVFGGVGSLGLDDLPLLRRLDAVADRRDARVSVTVGRKGRDVVLTVADNGPGIELDIADHLFTPFATSKKDGLGLGLGIARDIMTEFGGTLDLVPAPEGAIFRMILVKA